MMNQWFWYIYLSHDFKFRSEDQKKIERHCILLLQKSMYLFFKADVMLECSRCNFDESRQSVTFHNQFKLRIKTKDALIQRISSFFDSNPLQRNSPRFRASSTVAPPPRDDLPRKLIMLILWLIPMIISLPHLILLILNSIY